MLLEEQVQVLEVTEVSREVIHLKTSGGAGRAILYRRLCRDASVGDWVIVNTTAVYLHLGTGGWDIVRTVLPENEVNETSLKEKPDGHIMKLRYLGDQHSVLALEAPESDEHGLFKNRLSLKNKHVLIGELHSMLIIVWFLLSSKKPLVAVISDEASLPLPVSRNLEYLHHQPGFYSLTSGQAFGGKGEVINVATGLQYAAEKFPDAAVMVTLGPGAAGTGTTYGYSGLAQAEWANLTGSFGGTPVWIPRLSDADKRKRHQGISHHTVTPLTELTYAKSVLPLPSGTYSDPLLKVGEGKLSNYPHIRMEKIAEEKLWPKLDAVQKMSPFPLTSMGRTMDKDPLFFLGVAAAVHWYLEAELLHHSANV